MSTTIFVSDGFRHLTHATLYKLNRNAQEEVIRRFKETPGCGHVGCVYDPIYDVFDITCSADDENLCMFTIVQLTSGTIEDSTTGYSEVTDTVSRIPEAFVHEVSLDLDEEEVEDDDSEDLDSETETAVTTRAATSTRSRGKDLLPQLATLNAAEDHYWYPKSHQSDIHAIASEVNIEALRHSTRCDVTVIDNVKLLCRPQQAGDVNAVKSALRRLNIVERELGQPGPIEHILKVKGDGTQTFTVESLQSFEDGTFGRTLVPSCWTPEEEQGNMKYLYWAGAVKLYYYDKLQQEQRVHEIPKKSRPAFSNETAVQDIFQSASIRTLVSTAAPEEDVPVEATRSIHVGRWLDDVKSGSPSVSSASLARSGLTSPGSESEFSQSTAQSTAGSVTLTYPQEPALQNRQKMALDLAMSARQQPAAGRPAHSPTTPGLSPLTSAPTSPRVTPAQANPQDHTLEARQKMALQQAMAARQQPPQGRLAQTPNTPGRSPTTPAPTSPRSVQGQGRPSQSHAGGAALKSASNRGGSSSSPRGRGRGSCVSTLPTTSFKHAPTGPSKQPRQIPQNAPIAVQNNRSANAFANLLDMVPSDGESEDSEPSAPPGYEIKTPEVTTSPPSTSQDTAPSDLGWGNDGWTASVTSSSMTKPSTTRPQYSPTWTTAGTESVVETLEADQPKQRKRMKGTKHRKPAPGNNNWPPPSKPMSSAGIASNTLFRPLGAGPSSSSRVPPSQPLPKTSSPIQAINPAGIVETLEEPESPRGFRAKKKKSAKKEKLSSPKAEAKAAPAVRNALQNLRSEYEIDHPPLQTNRLPPENLMDLGRQSPAASTLNLRESLPSISPRLVDNVRAAWERSRIHRGPLSFQFEIGRILMHHDLRAAEDRMEWSQLRDDHLAVVSEIETLRYGFTPAITTSSRDVFAILYQLDLSVDDPLSTPASWNLICQSTDKQEVTVIVDAVNDTPPYVEINKHNLGACYIHHPQHMFDARSVLLGSKRQSPDTIPGVNDLIVSLATSTEPDFFGDQPFSYPLLEGRERPVLAVKEIQLRQSQRYRYRIDGNPSDNVYLQLTRVINPQINRRETKTIAGSQPFQMAVFTEQELSVNAGLWYELSIGLISPPHQFTENATTLELGAEASWTVDDIFTLEFKDDLPLMEHLANELVTKRLDNIGLANRGLAWRLEKQLKEKKAKKQIAMNRALFDPTVENW